MATQRSQTKPSTDSPGPAPKESGILTARQRPRFEASALSFFKISPRRSSRHLEQAYGAWREGWSGALSELGETTTLHSDEFAKQDEIGLLVDSRTNQWISVTALRWLDFSLPTSVHDSYFGDWPREILDTFRDAVVCITSNTVVAPHARSALIDHPDQDSLALKEVTIALSLCRFAESHATRFVGVARNDRAMHVVGATLGFRHIGSKIVHGITSDIMGCDKANMEKPGPLVRDLWSRREPE